MSGAYLVRGEYGGLVPGCRTCKVPLGKPHAGWCSGAAAERSMGACGPDEACEACGYITCACEHDTLPAPAATPPSAAHGPQTYTVDLELPWDSGLVVSWKVTTS